jgi:hypothetical protein
MSWNWELDYHRRRTAEFGTLASLASLVAAPARAPEPKFHYWQGGLSRAWFIHTVLPFTSSPAVIDANYIFVRRDREGKCTALYVGQSDNLSERMPRHEKFAAALSLGANEVHVHLLAATSTERFRVETDLRRGHPAPLNEQGAPSNKPMSLADLAAGFASLEPPRPIGGLFGLGSPLSPHRR